MSGTTISTPIGTVPLLFAEGAEPWRPSLKRIEGSVSAVVQSGRYLWVASDQTATVERLTVDNPEGPRGYRDHCSFGLGGFVTAPTR